MNDVFKKSTDDIKKELILLFDKNVPEKDLDAFLDKFTFDIIHINQSLNSFINQKIKSSYFYNDSNWRLVYEINSLINFNTHDEVISLTYQPTSRINAFVFNLKKTKNEKIDFRDSFFNAFQYRKEKFFLDNIKDVHKIVDKYFYENLIYINDNFENELFNSFEITYAIRNIIKKLFDSDSTDKHTFQFEKDKKYTPYEIYDLLNEKLEVSYVINDIDFSEEVSFLKNTINKYGKKIQKLDLKR